MLSCIAFEHSSINITTSTIQIALKKSSTPNNNESKFRAEQDALAISGQDSKGISML